MKRRTLSHINGLKLNNMQKEIRSFQIFTKTYEGIRDRIPFGDLPKDLLPDDTICIEVHEAEFGSDHASDAETILTVFRRRMETDEEFEERNNRTRKMLAASKARRREQYLTLKKEFENEN